MALSPTSPHTPAAFPWFALVAFAFSMAAIGGDTRATTGAVEVAEPLDRYFRALTDIDRFNGVVLWAEGDDIRLHESYHLDDLSAAGTVDVRTPFHIASIRKLFSEWLIDDAVSRNLLAPDDPVSRFLPDFPRGDDITIRHLLEHRSGLSRGESFQFEERFYPLEDYQDLIQSYPLEFDPGSQTRYSNFGYMMIDLILAEVSGTHPGDLIEQRLFDHVGMVQSFEYHRRPESAGIAIGLYEEDQKLKPVDALDIAQFETGHVFSTATDLLAFVRHPDVVADLADDGSIAHAGGKKGYRSWLYHDVETDRTLIVLSNLAATPIQRIIDETGAIIEGKPVALPQPIQREAIEVSDEILARYQGRYRVIANGQVIDVRLEDGGLVLHEVTEAGLVDPQRIRPETENTFFIEADSSDTIRFEPVGEDQRPRMVLSIMGGYELETERLDNSR